MAKWKVKYELRSYPSMVVEANTAEQAEKIVCEIQYYRYNDDVYDILSTTIYQSDTNNKRRE